MAVSLRHPGIYLPSRMVRRRYSPAALLLLFFTFLLPLQGRAAEPSNPAAQPSVEVGAPVLQSHTFKEYHGYGQIWTSLQDRSGVMYFGVTGGTILQYDGATWRRIFTTMSVIRSMVLDDSGRIWVGGSGNFGYLASDPAGSLQFVSLLDKIPAGDRGFTDVWQTLPTPHGTFFRSYELLFRWDGKSMHSWPTKTRFQALSQANGHIYVDQNGIGLQEIAGDELRNLPGGDGYSKSAKLFFHPYDGGRLLASERGGLLTLYDGQRVVPFPTGADEYFKKNEIYVSTLLKDGSLCVTTLHGGAVILEHDGKLRQILDKTDGLPDSDVLSAFQDREGALWLGSDQGVSRVEAASPISIFSRELTSSAIRFQGSVYVASVAANAAVARLVSDPKTHRTSLLPIGGASQGFSLKIFKDPTAKTPDQLLVSTSEGVMKVQGDTLVPAMPALKGPTEQTYTLAVSRKTPERVFMGHGNGVASMRWDGQKWIDEGRLPKTVFEARSFAEDAAGDLWVGGSEQQVLRIKVAATGMGASKVERLSAQEGVPSGSSHVTYAADSIFTSASRSKDMLRWDEAAPKFVVDNRFALPVDAPDASSAIRQDDQGYIWSQTYSADSSRFGRFARQGDGSWRLDEDTYRLLTRSYQIYAFTDPDGSIWTNGENLIRLDPHIASPASQPAPALIRQVNAGAKIVFGGAAFPGATELRLPPGSSALSFQFASPSYGNSAAINYQYLLDGADKDWSVWARQREANYSGLGPGHYRFRVRAQSDAGKIGPEGDYAFTILPPWYRTTLAYALYALLFLLLAVAGWVLIASHERQKAQRRTEALEAQAKALEATVNERTQEIRAQAAEIAAQKDSIELLSEIGKEITASLDLNTILFKLYERVNQIVDASIFGVGLYRPEKHLIEYTLAIENGKRYAPYTRSTDNKNQFAVWCIDHREPILLNDVENEFSRYIPVYKHNGGALEDGSSAQPPASMIYLPLVAQERVLGVLSIQSFKKNAYTEQHLSLLENLAAYTTIALDNANAYHVIDRPGTRGPRTRCGAGHHQPHHPGAGHTAR